MKKFLLGLIIVSFALPAVAGKVERFERMNDKDLMVGAFASSCLACAYGVGTVIFTASGAYLVYSGKKNKTPWKKYLGGALLTLGTGTALASLASCRYSRMCHEILNKRDQERDNVHAAFV